jgi:hypothetical protein
MAVREMVPCYPVIEYSRTKYRVSSRSSSCGESLGRADPRVDMPPSDEKGHDLSRGFITMERIRRSRHERHHSASDDIGGAKGLI